MTSAAAPRRAEVLAPGWPTGLLAVLMPMAVAQPVAVAVLLDTLLPDLQRLRAVGGVQIALELVALALAVVVVRRTDRMLPGAQGRARARFLGVASAIFSLLAAGIGTLPLLLEPEPGYAAVDVWATLPPMGQFSLVAAVVVALLASIVANGAAISCWFLMPLRRRRALWLIGDTVLLANTVAAFVPLIRQAEETLQQQGVRLVLSFLVFVRIGVRALPLVLDRIEAASFRSLVAARLLRAKKSGFLAAISVLSILAVTVASFALSVTLSIMGGFRQDLKRKILGNNAHILIDKDHESFDGWAPLVQLASRTEGVRGVSPYASGEVMVSSASNLAGAVLRGIDPDRIGQVSELPSNITAGSLKYLKQPEKLLDLPPEKLQLGLPPGATVRFADDEDDLPPAEGAQRLLDDIDELLDDIEAERRNKAQDKPTEPASDKAPPRFLEPDIETSLSVGKAPPKAAVDALPGIIVGRELARSLRLYLGDEVNVVSPLGDLGPAGPMPKARGFRVAGIFYSGMYEYDMKYVYVTLETAQRFLSVGSAVSGIEITVDEPEGADRVAANLSNALQRPSLRVRPWQELNKNLFGALALEKLAMFIALGIAILVASFCIVGTLTLMVQEKGREVAVLKALGTKSSTVAQIFVIKGALIGMFGAVLGLSIGYVACFAAEHFGVHLNPEVYYIDRLPVHIDPAEFATVGIATVVVCVLATLYPARLASRVQPVDGLRYE